MANLVPKLDSTTLVTRAMRLPGIKINRGDFLYKQFRNRYPYETVRKAIEMNPAAAGISPALSRGVKVRVNKGSSSPSGIQAARAAPPSPMSQFFSAEAPLPGAHSSR